MTVPVFRIGRESGEETRHLSLRLWLSIPGDRESCPRYSASRYGTIETGNRGGIIVQGYSANYSMDDLISKNTKTNYFEMTMIFSFDFMSIRSKLGLFDLTMIIISLVIGVGIFKTPGIVAEKAGSPAVFYMAWVAGGIVSIFRGVNFC